MILLKKHPSREFAKNRLKTVLLSERIDCSAQMLVMMQNDLIQAVGKYMPVDAKHVKFRFVPEKHTLEAFIPVLQTQEKKQDL